MKNKILFQQRLKLINQLLDSVNSKEEFEFLLAERDSIINNLSLKGGAQI